MSEIVRFNNKKTDHPITERTDETRKQFQRWNKLETTHFPRWAWELACRRNPSKYTMFLPEYQGKKVMMT